MALAPQRLIDRLLRKIETAEEHAEAADDSSTRERWLAVVQDTIEKLADIGYEY